MMKVFGQVGPIEFSFLIQQITFGQNYQSIISFQRFQNLYNAI